MQVTFPQSLIYSLSILKGDSLVGNDFGLYGSVKKFRTFRATFALSELSKKIKFRKKDGLLLQAPNFATARDAVFQKIGKSGSTFLGVAQTNSTSAKEFGWLFYKMGSDFGKMFTVTHIGTSYPIDYIRGGNKLKKLKGKIKAYRSKYNNSAWEQGVLLRFNIISSQKGITPPGFGDLAIDVPFVFAGRQMQGQTLFDAARWLDSTMTYWDTLGVDNPVAFANLEDFITNILKPINNGFHEDIPPLNYRIDTIGVMQGKNPYAMELLGIKTAAEIGIVKQKSNTIDFNDEDNYEIPIFNTLAQNYPNPFNPSTAISFQISAISNVTLKIYNVLGQEVATLLNKEEIEEGQHEIEFDASRLSSSVYFYRISVAQDGIARYNETKKLLLMK